VLSIIIDNIGIRNGQNFFILIYSIFIFILFNNFQGLIPYNFTVTSHLILTFSFSLSIFIGTNLFCISLHGLKFFSLFMPRGTPILLAFLLVPIELVSFIFKPISLSIRLFANMMAGHTLLKVIAGFS
jgi:F-type H+-transporting ATPase subunit a